MPPRRRVASDFRLQMPSERPGEMIGPYKLLQLIGEGGFGTVYMAEQEHPVRRRVALKIIKLGMDTRQVIARFEAERQALAMMDHPGIAKVFDAGATATGRPYFVMELVKGEPITDYCDKNNLSIAQRLELFVQVCQAVQHAHQKGLIHRDIKPSNVLVSTQDDRPVAKVIDFGIAKATQARLTEKTLFTEFKQLIGTPEYMSPEQAEGDLDIDTRSDVYFAGRAAVRAADRHDAVRRARSALQGVRRDPANHPRGGATQAVHPPVPEHRHAGGRGGAPAHRAAQAQRSVRGELDWIVMKCLEKDRARRYETASSVAMDVQRHLSDEPVAAAPPSATYRLRKFVRRNTGPVLASRRRSASLLLAATIFSTCQAVTGDGAPSTAAEAEKRQADQQAVTATTSPRPCRRCSARPIPNAAKGPDYTVQQLIDDFAANLEEKLADQPAAAADLHATIGKRIRLPGPA